jgi:hypothetical protein
MSKSLFMANLDTVEVIEFCDAELSPDGKLKTKNGTIALNTAGAKWEYQVFDTWDEAAAQVIRSGKFIRGVRKHSRSPEFFEKLNLFIKAHDKGTKKVSLENRIVSLENRISILEGIINAR